TLLQIALDDQSIKLDPLSDEVGDAVMGLAGYQNFRGIEVDILLDGIAGGIATFARRKTEIEDDRTIAWRVYAARLTQSLLDLKKTNANNATLTRFTDKINSLTNTAISEVLSPIEKLGPNSTRKPNPSAMSTWRARLPDAPLAPFTELKSMKINPQIRQQN
ncbi:MAG: hypothetical protein ACRCZF_17670, partial [Gemmataceae bacterium]